MSRSLAVAAILASILMRFPPLASAGDNYNFYIGNLHSHTSYSDGVGTPADAFAHARDIAKLDFLAVTDHNLALVQWEFNDIRNQASAFNQDGVFVAIAGQEWSGEGRNHCNVFESDHIITVPAGAYDSLYGEIARQGLTANFNHPGSGCFDGYAYSATGDVGINSVEVRNDGEYAFYAEILNKGWHVGTDGSEDNHRATWGDGQTWTVVLAESLTKAQIFGAARDFRTYSTYDRNLRLTFKSGDHWMGDAFADSGNIGFTVGLQDRSPGDSTVLVDLCENGRSVAWTYESSGSFEWTPQISPRCGLNNYTVRVRQAGPRCAWSSPIWITTSTDLPSTPALEWPGPYAVAETATPEISWYPSSNAESYTLQYSTSPAFPPGLATVTIEGLADTTYLFPHYLADRRYYYCRVWAHNSCGTSIPCGAGSFLVDMRLFPDESEQRLTADPAEDGAPALLQAGSDFWLAWASNRDGNYEIYYKTSSDSGRTWSEDVRLTNIARRDDSPAIALASNGDIWLVWSSREQGMDGYEIYCRQFDGSSWSDGQPLTDSPGPDVDPTVAQSGDGRIWVAWSSGAATETEIYGRSFDGVAWSETEQLTDDPGDNTSPVLFSAGQDSLWLLWTSNRSGHFEIYRKIFDGQSWSGDGLLLASEADVYGPTVAKAGEGQMWLAYGKHAAVYYREYVAGQWADESMLPSASNVIDQPTLAQGLDGGMWLAYSSVRDGNCDIYAQRTACIATAGVDGRGGADGPEGPVLLPARPNPFSNETTVKFVLAKDSFVDAAIYNILGQRVRTLLEGRTSPGDHSIRWDGRSDRGERMPSGLYFCRVAADGASATGKVLLLN